MAKMRIHELAKELNDTAGADIVKFLQENGSDAKTVSSSISEEEAALVRKHFSGKSGQPAPEQTRASEPKNAAEPKKEAPEKAAPAKAAAPAQDKSAKPAEPRKGGQPPRVGRLKGPDGKLFTYKALPDGRIVNAETGKLLPLRWTPNGLRNLDGSPLGARKPEGAPGQGQRQQQGRPGQPQKPVSQVFDGRSEKDKRNASGTAQARPSHGGLSDALGDRVLDLKSQLKPVPPQPVEQPKPKKPAPIPDPVKVPDTPAPEPVKVEEPAAPVVQPVVDKPQEEPVRAESPRQESPRQDRPQSDRPQGDRPQGERRSQSDRPQGERRPYGDRPQGDRPQGERRPYGDRPQGERRPYGDRPQGDRPQGERRPYGDRPQGERRPYGDRPQGDRPQGERRPYGDRPQGERRPYGDRPQGDRPQGERRPYGDRPQGERRPYGDRPQGSFGDRPAFGQRGPAGGFSDKDKDGDQRRSFARRNDARPTGGSIKSELANELGKGQRAESLKDRKRDKNDRRDRDFDEDGAKKAGKKDPNRKGAFQKPVVKAAQQEEDDIKTIVVPEVITIKDLADKMKQPAAAIIKKLFMAGKMVNLNSEISFEEAEEIALEYEIICEKEVKVNMVEELLKDTDEDPELLEKRPPVVCVMGHVDHGKTSLLDAIRATNVTAREAGGITQHIGAYMVEINGRKITFLDTPGHEAFTTMRMRGARSTDIAILVIAADDGVMPQTVEAINHAKAANVQIIVAVNKIDKPGANVDRVKQELTEHGLVAEDWGGETVFVPVSAKTHEGIENLLEMVLLTADVLELKANPNRRARGIVIEAQLDKGRGPVATVMIQKGTLNVGDNVAIGATHGKVRAMIDDKGRKVKSATPSTPVELLGLNGVPEAGEVMMAVADEKEARTIAEAFIVQSKERLIAETKERMKLDSLFSKIEAGEVKDLNLIIKADVMGSVEAVKQSLTKLSNEEVVVRVIHGGVGNINESDVNLAAASNAIIIGFNVKPDNQAKDTAEREGVDVKLYRVIYDAINDIELAMKGMLKPIYEEKVLGHAEVRQLFKASGLGIIAGSFVLDGKIERGCKARISREGKQIWEGPLASLKRFKDDVKEVAAGYECGLVFEKYNDLAELDQVEFYTMVEVPRT